jgi:ABC-type polysaccharide/polyol phosphate transport system ATPase subunit
MARIALEDVCVSFPIYTSHTRSLRAEVFTNLGGKLAEHNRSITVEALRSVDLEFTDGDRVALIGPNGAGKTTLLRTVSGVYTPDRGRAEIEGRVSSFTDITLGMDPEATGRENILFRSVFMGMTFAEAKRLTPAIAEFSELGEYLDLPVRTYSTGMFVRLAFAISTSISPDIVVMDEMIGAGDQQFIQKAQRRIGEMLAKSKILVLASHDMSIVRSICNIAVWLVKGEVKARGKMEAVVNEYLASAAVV